VGGRISISPTAPSLCPLPAIFLTHQNSISVDRILLLKEFQIFVDASKHFCSFIEKGSADTEREFLLLTQNHLLTLYNLGRNLPIVRLETDTTFDVDVDDAEMKALLKFIGERVPFSYYWAVLNPVDEAGLPETGTGDLIDDLGDIYSDLKKALILFGKDDLGAKENAIFQFKFGYENHWGEHCIEALYAIHHFLQVERQ
jgi:hypothetical protein